MTAVPVTAYLAAGVAIASWLACHATARESAPRAAAGPAPRPHVAASHPGSPELPDLVARAEQSLVDSLPLDYRRPFSDSSSDRPATRQRFLEACRAGHRPSCWTAWYLEPQWHESSEAFLLIRANCAAGDLMSCRAILPLPMMDPRGELPGAAGRSQACWTTPDEPGGTGCDVAALRRECRARFSASCRLLVMHRRSAAGDPGDAALTSDARLAELAEGECDAGLISACLDARLFGSRDRRPGAASWLERECRITPFFCQELLQHLLDARATIQARDVAERRCQYGANTSRDSCADLGDYYVTGVLPEPVPGRGRALLEWACDATTRRNHPACKAGPFKRPGSTADPS